MKSIRKLLSLTAAALATLLTTSPAEPLLNSWSTESSGQYARVYESKASALAGTAVSTWSGQTLPAYSDISKVEHSNDWVYISSTGLASHLMGPWYLNAAKTTTFPNWPANQSVVDRFPKNPVAAATKQGNYLNSLGRWVNGVALFNMLDGAFYANGAETQDMGAGVQTAYWIRNAMKVEVVTFDNTNGHQPPTGDYHYHADPKALRYQLGDNVSFTPMTGLDNAGVYSEDISNLKHSPILGWSYDGFPVYGPYGYSDPDPTSTDTTIRRIVSGFVPRDGQNGTDNLASTGRVALAKWSAQMRGLTTTGTTYPITNSNQQGPAVSTTYVIGYWVEDFAFLGNLGFTQGTDFDLDVYNGRFCRTPDFPNGTYAYFVTIDVNNEPAFPYVVGRQWYGAVTGGAVNAITETTTTLIDAGANSQPNLDHVALNDTNNTITLTWSSVEGGQYSIETSDDLTAWQPLAGTIAATALSSTASTPVAISDPRKFYRVLFDNVATYDTGSGGGNGAVGTGNPTAGYVFAFTDGPPTANLISNVRVGTVPGTVVNYAVTGPTGGTVTISFNDSTFTPGTAYRATYTHTPPGIGTTTAVSTNSYTK